MKGALKACLQSDMPVAIDADGLRMFSSKDELLRLKGRHNVVLTPNVVELKRLCFTAGVEASAGELAKFLLGPTILEKAAEDVICDGHSVVVSSQQGSPRRVGG